MTRDELQREAVNTLLNKSRLILQWATGVGKSRVAIKALQELPESKVLLVVAETAHKENWRKEFMDYLPEDEFNRLFKPITVECYASLKNYRDTEWDLIIFDEGHHLGSDLRLDILQSLIAKRVLVLSATLSDASLVETLSVTFGPFESSKVTLQEAIAIGWLPEPKIFVVPLLLDYVKRDQIIIEEWGKASKRVQYECTYSERWKYLRAKKVLTDVTLTIHCTQYEKYCYLSDQFDYWRKQYFVRREEYIKAKWLQFGSQRKRFMGNLKTGIAKQLLETLEGHRYICFCASIEQAKDLGGINAIHSQNKDSQKIIKSFNNKEIDTLFAVGMLQEGQNLQDIEYGVIIQLDGEERAFIQKFGRTLRAEDPVQYIFYFKNTRDEEYLEKVLDGINSEYIREINV